jgi:transcriptional regulator with XRE-family HTH domain
MESLMIKTSAPGDRDPIDVHVGAKLRAFRKLRRIPQKALSEAVEVSFQQLHKYETGANRISVAVLYRLARRLAVPIDAFFEGLPETALGDPAYPIEQTARP